MHQSSPELIMATLTMSPVFQSNLSTNKAAYNSFRTQAPILASTALPAASPLRDPFQCPPPSSSVFPLQIYKAFNGQSPSYPGDRIITTHKPSRSLPLAHFTNIIICIILVACAYSKYTYILYIYSIYILYKRHGSF